MPVDSYSLADLEARLLKFYDESHFEEVQTLAEAEGMMFLCPKCFHENGGAKGTHSIPLWFSKLGPERCRQLQGHEGWHASGTDLSDLTFTGPGAASVLLKMGCKWHGFIRNGRATLK